jgi:DNA-binding response OmpR family regulator
MTMPQCPTVLLLEDEAIIAFDLEESLRDAGFTFVTSISTCAGALAWLEEYTPSVAIVDPRLKDGRCDDVVRTLNERNVPFVIYSGDAPDEVGGDFHRGAWLPKPSAPCELLKTMTSAMNGV